ncbi:class D sortase [Alkalicoccobacillus plakortidis]|uniref:Class D sortase n=1 Tax=Alkalicoccobacillus plakortidis TaxID=444060 RepID=A0ABT0XL46_9BACI|nr:class D sortase [Alkalicoccobacillus plakortidis]MCM2675927.1 class D sortase [Alkalicoccobacillus plakortidis]
MIRWVGRLCLVTGASFLLYVGYLLVDFYFGSNYQMEATEDYLREYGYDSTANETKLDEALLMKREDFSVKLGDSIGKIQIPSIDLSMPIVHGSELENLKHGVGHDPQTGFPGDGEQVFLAGHNDSAFLHVGEVEQGDLITIDTPYGQFEYIVDSTEIGHESETWRVGEGDEETLVLMTCYPFFSLTRPEERYFVYAIPTKTDVNE